MNAVSLANPFVEMMVWAAGFGGFMLAWELLRRRFWARAANVRAESHPAE